MKDQFNGIYEAIRDTSQKKRLLLHACCGPCVAGALSAIAPYFDITVFFYNPNILPNEEFIRRLEALKTVIAYFGNVKLIVPEQRAEEFVTRAASMRFLPEGGARCTFCFNLRLDKTAQFLAQNRDKFDCFATTLTVSPHKNAALINDIGLKVADEYGVNYLTSDFKKHDGFLHSTQLSKQLGIYRQNYCGCGWGN